MGLGQVQTFYLPIKVSIAVPKPGLREANSIDTDADKDGAAAAYYQQYGHGAAQQGYYAQAAGKGPAVLVSSQVGFEMESLHFLTQPDKPNQGIYLYRVVQLDLTPEIEVFFTLFGRSLSIKYFNSR